MIDYDYDKLAKMDFFKVKRKHKSMPMSERASIFMPFNALEGYQDKLRQAEIRHAKQFQQEERIYKYGKE